MKQSTIGDLKVWWIRNPPSNALGIPVKNVDEALKQLDILAKADLRNHHVWANIGGLEIYTKDGWEEYYNEDGDSIDEIKRDKK